MAKKEMEKGNLVFNFRVIIQKETTDPLRRSSSMRYDVMCRPATFILFIRCGNEKPSTTGT